MAKQPRFSETCARFVERIGARGAGVIAAVLAVLEAAVSAAGSVNPTKFKTYQVGEVAFPVFAAKLPDAARSAWEDLAAAFDAEIGKRGAIWREKCARQALNELVMIPLGKAVAPPDNTSERLAELETSTRELHTRLRALEAAALAQAPVA